MRQIIPIGFTLCLRLAASEPREIEEAGRCEIPLTKTDPLPFATGLKAVEGFRKDCSLDWKSIGEATDKWFETQKKERSDFYLSHEKRWQTLIDETKAENGRALEKLQDDWKRITDDALRSFLKSGEAFYQAGPKAVLTGKYRFREGGREGSSFGRDAWEINGPVFENCNVITGQGSYDSGEVTLKASSVPMFKFRQEGKMKLEISADPDPERAHAGIAGHVARPSTKAGFWLWFNGSASFSQKQTFTLFDRRSIELMKFPRIAVTIGNTGWNTEMEISLSMYLDAGYLDAPIHAVPVAGASH